MKMFMTLGLVLLSQMALATINPFQGSAKPLALVYKGKGACFGCELGAAKTALRAGFNVLYVDEKLTDFTVFDQATVWLQPGGVSKTAALAMGEPYLQKIRDFVANGGGYVGFCAGAFLSTEMIGATSTKGLGIVPGKTRVLFSGKEDKPKLLSMTWFGQEKRITYFNGGPYINLEGVNDPNLKVISTYDNMENNIAGITTRFGKGKVAITGAHPEHLGILKLIHFRFDPDGIDRDLATRMVEWTVNEDALEPQ